MCSQDTSCAPDTAHATVTADDPDGIDSVWLTFDGKTVGEDGFFEPGVRLEFSLPVRAGLAPGIELPVQARARDVPGFQHAVEDTVRVIR